MLDSPQYPVNAEWQPPVDLQGHWDLRYPPTPWGRLGRWAQAQGPLPGFLMWELRSTMYMDEGTDRDFLEVFELPKGRVAIVLADSSGPDSALALSLTRSLMRVFSGVTRCDGATVRWPIPDPLSIVQRTNAHVFETYRGRSSVPLFFGILDLESGALSYINAGYEPPVIVDDKGGVQAALLSTGPALGAYQQPLLFLRSICLRQGETLLGASAGLRQSLDLVLSEAHHPPCNLLQLWSERLDEWTDAELWRDDGMALLLQRSAPDDDLASPAPSACDVTTSLH